MLFFSSGTFDVKESWSQKLQLENIITKLSLGAMGDSNTACGYGIYNITDTEPAQGQNITTSDVLNSSAITVDLPTNYTGTINL